MTYYRVCGICGDVRKTHDHKQAGLTRCNKHQGQEHSIKVQIDNYFEKQRVSRLSKWLD